VGRAKGSNMHHMRTFVERRVGPSAWESVIEAMTEEDREVLRSLVPVGWYDLGLQHRVLRCVDERIGTGDGALVDEVARYEAEQDLTVVHRLFLRFANPAFVLEKAGEYWGRFYDTGRWTVRRESPRAASAVLEGVVPFDALFARYLHEYVRRMWELVGAKDVVVTRRVVDDAVHLRGHWK